MQRIDRSRAPMNVPQQSYGTRATSISASGAASKMAEEVKEMVVDEKENE
jgi:hypothetical protein